MNTIAAPDCYGCLETGRIVGFGCSGLKCPCVALCEECGEAIAYDHGDDEWKPDLCEACVIRTNMEVE